MKFRSAAAALLSLSFLLVLFSGAQAQPQTQDKVLHMFLSTSETGLDPAVASDNATLSLLENLFDPLLRYDYLARPARLRANRLMAPAFSPTFMIPSQNVITPASGRAMSITAILAESKVPSMMRLKISVSPKKSHCAIAARKPTRKKPVQM